MCDESNGWPTEIFFENSDVTSIVGVRDDDWIEFKKHGPNVGPNMH